MSRHSASQVMAIVQVCPASTPSSTLSKLKPQTVKISYPNLGTSSTENLRDLIMDYIIQNLFRDSHKQTILKRGPRRACTLKSIQVVLRVEVNSVPRVLNLDALTILQCYIQHEKKNVYRQQNIEPLIIDILNFFDEIEEIAADLSFEISDKKSVHKEMIHILLDKYHRDKQRISQLKDLQQLKSKSKTIAKYTRISYLDLESSHLQKKECDIFVEKTTNHQLSHRISRDTLESLHSDQQTFTKYMKEHKKTYKSKLRDLVDKCRVFQHPEKIEALRKQKLNEAYGVQKVQQFSSKIETERVLQSEEDKNVSGKSQDSKQQNGGYLDQDCATMLSDWIDQISLSQKLYSDKCEGLLKNEGNRQFLNAKIVEQPESESSIESQAFEANQMIMSVDRIKLLEYWKYNKLQLYLQWFHEMINTICSVFLSVKFIKLSIGLEPASVDKIIMSFQGIRKIRDSRRGSPLIFGSDHLENSSLHLSPSPLNLKLKSGDTREKKSTRDSEKKTSSNHRDSRRSSFGMNNSRQKERRTMFGNFLHINLDGLGKINASKELRSVAREGPRTERIHLAKSSTEDFEREEPERKIAQGSFHHDFVVGKGGFGKVWKVREKHSQNIYAVKEMQKVKIISKRSVHSVMNEKRLLEKLHHPFLVNMVHAFQTREQLFLVMDYCNRGDMRYHIGNRRKFKEEESRFFLACIVLALEYLHKHKVMHRDLKPENLVLDDRGYVRLTDLGVSREAKPNNAEDTSGTPGYMAPEVICKLNHSFEVDFFALGVIAYEFMVGKRPYIGQNRKQIREKILAKQVQLDEIPPFGWGRESIDFVNRLIQRKPENRLGHGGIAEVKGHAFFRKIDWEKLEQRKLMAPFLPFSIEEDYSNYKECISEDTEIEDVEEYRLVLRHKDTQEAFLGYEYNVNVGSPRARRKLESRDLDSFTQTTMGIRRRKSNLYN